MKVGWAGKWSEPVPSWEQCTSVCPALPARTPAVSTWLSLSMLPLAQLVVLADKWSWEYGSGQQGMWTKLGLQWWNRAGWTHKKQSSLVHALLCLISMACFYLCFTLRNEDIFLHVVTLDQCSSSHSFLSRISKVSTNGTISYVSSSSGNFCPSDALFTDQHEH